MLDWVGGPVAIKRLFRATSGFDYTLLKKEIMKTRYWNPGARVHYTLVTLAALAFIWFLNYWNLLGWRL